MKNILYILIFLTTVAFVGSCVKGDSNQDIGPSPVGGDSGKAGSMAKFSISNDHLFLINEKELIIYDISNPVNPFEVNKLEVNFGIETVFTLKDKLFIGSNDGVYIYDISNPLNILYLSHYTHITSCDPVVANDTIAFATLNSQSACRWQNGANQLDVIDIRNIVYPTNIASYSLQDPKGLAIDSNFVFVCNGQSGVRIYDFTDPQNLKQVSGINGIDAYDIILDEKILYLVGKEGLFQYDYKNLYNIKLLSNISF